MLENFGTLLSRVLAIDAHLPQTLVFTQQAADQRGLAGAIGAHQRNPVAPVDVQVDAVEHPVALKLLGNLLETYHQSRSPSPLNLKVSELVGQASTQRPQRVQSAPISTSRPRARPLMTVFRTWGTRHTLRHSPS